MKALLPKQFVSGPHFVSSSRCQIGEEITHADSVDDSVNSFTATVKCNCDTCHCGIRGTRNRPNFAFCNEEGLEKEVDSTRSSMNDEFEPTDEQESDILLERRTPDSVDEHQYRQLHQECETLRKEKTQLSRALTDLETESEVLAVQCSKILEENNAKLKAALDAVSELNGIVKCLKKQSQDQSKVISELKVEKKVLSNRLDTALSELYMKTGNATFTTREKLLITPRHPYGSIKTLTSTSHD
eukprot:g3715.t1